MHSQSPEAAVVQLFEEVKRHKPSVIYIPNINTWYDTLADSVKRTFVGLLKSLPPTDPVLLLGILEHEAGDEEPANPQMLRELFGYSAKNQFELKRLSEDARKEFFENIIQLLRTPPTEFPDDNRKKRKLDVLPIAPPPEQPKGPSKEELQRQKRQDRIVLNNLKLHINPIMEQIKKSYRKFRVPVIDEATISYLFDEQDPLVLTTDLTDEQKQQQQLFRPFEIEEDEKGVKGLREAATGKFYYNLEIVTIEKRLSNGYYKRPRDFTADIKRLAKDAKTLGDEDRTLKANEMLANVEVDIATIENTQATLVAQCNAVYERERAREQKLLQDARDAKARGEEVPRIMPNMPPSHASKTTTEGSGPVVLGQEVPGRQLFPITPHRAAPESTHWSTTNGSHPSHQTNGSAAPSHAPEDSEMLDNQAEVPHQPQQHNTQSQHQYSQVSAHTHIAHGSQLDQYQNDASTTTSGQKTSDRSSGPFSIHTQSTNGFQPGDHPDFTYLGPARHGSQIPDTQDPSAASQPSQPSPPPQQQNMAPPRPQQSTTTRASSINALLNNEPAIQQHQLLVDEAALQTLHNEMTRRSTGLSLEQIEQVNAALMDVIWRQRGDWNRNRVWVGVQRVFNEVVDDIERCQVVLDPSQRESGEGRGRGD